LFAACSVVARPAAARFFSRIFLLASSMAFLAATSVVAGPAAAASEGAVGAGIEVEDEGADASAGMLSEIWAKTGGRSGKRVIAG
jgi:hypothetical protein